MMRPHTPGRRAIAIAVLCVIAGAARPAAGDASGKWAFGTSIVDVSDVGGTVTFTLFGATFTGSLESLTGTGLACPANIRGVASADQRHLRATVGLAFPPMCSFPGFSVLNADRCTCLDGNSVDGDGCSARCQIEPCYTCTGTPSVCVPSGDGAPCDDEQACTSGETCTAGVCGGGAPQVGCFDLRGGWGLHIVHDFGEFDTAMQFTQHGTFVEGDHLAGELNTNTGAFALTSIPSDVFDFLCPPDTMTGQIGANGSTLSGMATDYVRTPTACTPFAETITGGRCGGGTLDAGEQCDDGNASAGDGCSPTCTLEPCWSCSGEPSDCTAAGDGDACSATNACVVGGVCAAGACVGGTPVTCAACEICDPAAGCVSAPRLDCGSAASASLVAKDAAEPNRDLLTWRWQRGNATDLAALGTPTLSTGYDICVYDESTTTPALLFHAAAPAGSGWKSTGKGFAFRGDAVRSVTLKAGADGRAAATFKLKADLPPPPFNLPLTVQLQGAGAACFTTTFDAADVRINSAGRFKAK
ncbi:MAG: hypothetical protein SF182_12785 [Deltaproteobacteria bacterium]|nr:hypothetical protein [Deltaproteobacteria bacterium]